MNVTTVEFLSDLHELLEKYNVTVEVETSPAGWSGDSVDGVCFTIPPVDPTDYKDYVMIDSKWFASEDIKKALEKARKKL